MKVINVTVILSLCLLLSAAAFGQEGNAGQARAAARRLCAQYFEKKYQIAGAEVRSDITLGEPEEVPGWFGRWRMTGRAVLRHYRSPENDAQLRQREEELSNDRQLSGREIRDRINRGGYIKSETVDFEVEVSNLDTTPDISVTLK